MVTSDFARQDVDNELLTKVIQYVKKSHSSPNLLSGASQIETETLIPIKAQATVQNIESRHVQEGRLKGGDLVGLFRHEYTHDANGHAIIPTLIPRQGDKIQFLGDYYEIKACTPATGEDDGIIAWDFTAGK